MLPGAAIRRDGYWINGAHVRIVEAASMTGGLHAWLERRTAVRGSNAAHESGVRPPTGERPAIDGAGEEEPDSPYRRD